MGWILIVVGVIGIISSILFQKNGVRNVKKERRYISYLAADILLYVSEICTMFGIFLLATDNPLHTTEYRIKEDSLLKVFIDFFVIYQITLLIIFKLIDGHFINACQMMNRSIIIARNVVQGRMSAESYLDTHIGNETEYSLRFPVEVMHVYADMIKDMKMYEEEYQTKSLDDTVIDHYLYMLDGNQSFIERLVELKQDEWGVSILKRIHKSEGIKKYRISYHD